MMRKAFFKRSGLAMAAVLMASLMALAQTDGGSPAAGAKLSGSAGVVKTQGYLSTDGVRPGDKFKIVVALDIASGYHVQGHLPSDPNLIATEVKFAPVAGLTIKEPTYPAPKYQKLESLGDAEYAVHDGTIYITAEAEADQTIKPGALT